MAYALNTKHLTRYLAKFYYWFNRRLWGSHMSDRMLTVCVTNSTITFADLKA